MHNRLAIARALLVVDMQRDFMEGGALATDKGSEVVAPIARLMRSARFDLVVGTQDWHPPGHISFATQHAGRSPFETIPLYGHDQTLWPDHCVQGSASAALHSALPWDTTSVVIRKGDKPDVDSYSGFRDNWDSWGRRAPTGLAGLLREREISQVAVCGLAREVCVLWTAQDAAAAGFDTIFIWDATRPVDAATDRATRATLERAEVEITETATLLSA